MEINPEVVSDAAISALWAIDPNDRNLHPSPGSLAEAKYFLGGKFSQVHPIYICSNEYENESLEALRGRLQEFLSPLHVGPTCHPEVYRASSAKRAEWVERILDLTHIQKDEVILMSSHGRSSVGAFILGSFASEILKESDIPVLFLSSSQFPDRSSHKVLFATDLSGASKLAFAKFLNFIKGKSAEVILCHIVELPLRPSNEKVAKIEKIMSLPDYFVEYQKEWARVEIEEFLKDTHYKKLNLKVINVVEESRDSIAHALEKVAKREGARLLGVAAHGKPFEKFWLGSVVQGLLSSQSFNLWVCGPHCKSARS